MTDEVELAVAAKRIGETDDVVCQVSDGVRLDAFRTGTVRIASLVRGKSFVAFGCQFLQQRDPDERAFREAVEQDDERSVIVESGGTVGVLKAVCFQNVFFTSQPMGERLLYSGFSLLCRPPAMVPGRSLTCSSYHVRALERYPLPETFANHSYVFPLHWSEQNEK